MVLTFIKHVQIKFHNLQAVVLNSLSGAFQCTTAAVYESVTVLHFALKMFSCDVKCLHEQLALLDTKYWYSHKSRTETPDAVDGE